MYAHSDGSVLANTSGQLLTDDSFLQACRKDFKSNFNLRSFKFNHTLHRSGLFEIPRIIEISRRMIESEGDYFL